MLDRPWNVTERGMGEADSGDADFGPDLTNKSVVKAMGLLTELGRFPNGARVTELALAVGVSRPTVFRLLQSLTQTGFAEKLAGKYKLGWKFATLGLNADLLASVLARVQPFLNGLATELNETVNYALVTGLGGST